MRAAQGSEYPGGERHRGLWARGAAASLVLWDMGSQRACGLIWEPMEAKSSTVEEENMHVRGTGRLRSKKEHGRGSKRDSRAWEGGPRGQGDKGVGGDGEPVELREGKIT